MRGDGDADHSLTTQKLVVAELVPVFQSSSQVDAWVKLLKTQYKENHMVSSQRKLNKCQDGQLRLSRNK